MKLRFISFSEENLLEQTKMHYTEIHERGHDDRQFSEESTQRDEKRLLKNKLNVEQLKDSDDRVRRPCNDVRTDEYDDRLHRTVLDSQALAVGCLANVGDRVARLMVEDMLLVMFAAVERRETLRIGDLLVEIEGRLRRVDLPDDLMDAYIDGEEND